MSKAGSKITVNSNLLKPKNEILNFKASFTSGRQIPSQNTIFKKSNDRGMKCSKAFLSKIIKTRDM